MTVGRCANCGGEYFGGASDCPRCNAPVPQERVELIEGAPRGSHVAGGVFAALVAWFGLWNVYRGLSGLSIYFFRRRASDRWITIEHDPDAFWFLMCFWAVVGSLAAYYAWKELRLGIGKK